MGKDWLEIPRDIVAKIAEHVELYDDFEAFAEVCSEWRLAIKEDNRKYTNKSNMQLPLLTLVDADDCSYRRLYSLTKRKFLKINVPSSVLEPGKEDDQTRRDNPQVAFWRPGQDKWSRPESESFSDFEEGYIYDICFFRGELYGINGRGYLIAYGDLDDPNKHPPRVVANLERLIGGGAHPGSLYLMEFKPGCEFEGQTSHLLVLQKILFVQEHRSMNQPRKYKTTSFKAWMVNVENGEVERLSSLGNQAIFVGFNSTFSVKAYANIDDECGGCKSNCIYFTDDNYEVYCRRKGGRDMGIYSLALDKHVHYRHLYYHGPSRYSRLNPPTWLEFPSA